MTPIDPLHPELDKETKYQTRGYFRRETLAAYAKKAQVANKPLGVVLVEVPKAMLEGDQRGKTLQDITGIIDSLQIQTEGQTVSFDAKARDDEHRYVMLIRIADQDVCSKVNAALNALLQQKGYAGSRVTAQSFDPAKVQLTPEKIMDSLESALG